MSEAYEFFQKGLAALASGHADEAIVPLERAKNMEPDKMSIHEALGKTYLRVGFYDRAIQEFATILAKEPIDAYAHFCLARAYDKLGKFRLARRHYRLATFFAPDRAIYRDTMRVFMHRAFPQGDFDDIDDDDDDDDDDPAAGVDS